MSKIRRKKTGELTKMITSMAGGTVGSVSMATVVSVAGILIAGPAGAGAGFIVGHIMGWIGGKQAGEKLAEKIMKWLKE